MTYAIPSVSMGQLSGISLSGVGHGHMSMIDEITHLSGRGMTIRIVPANGGTVIAIKDESQSSSNSNLYVIGQDQDLGQEIGKIITMNILKKE